MKKIINRRKKEEGFTLFEVLLGILIGSIFVSSTLELMLISSMMRVKANISSSSTEWIREDIERVRLTAKNLVYSETNCKEYAQALQNEIEQQEFETIRYFGGNKIVLTRTSISDGDSLQLSYSAVLTNDSSSSNDNTISEYNTEVIPYAAFSCP
jgi:type II secretory pathway pseudopilin PulG